MAGAPLTSEEFQALRQRLVDGERRIDAPTAWRLVGEIDRLRHELAQARATFASKAAAALEKRLHVVATYNHGGCPNCRDAEARAFLAKLRKVQQEPEAPSDR